MKLIDSEYLENVELYVKNHVREFEIDFRLESYSCKMVGIDKKEWARNVKNGTGANDLQPLSPPEESYFSQLTSAPFGNFNSGRLRHSSEVSHSGGSDNDNIEDNYSIVVGTVSRKTLFNLTSVLNLSYNDYDFSQTKSDRFFMSSISECMKNVQNKFATALPNFVDIKDQFWKVIDDEIKIEECILFSYMANFADDPYTENCIWSFNYFFWNRHLKRILFLSCRALRPESLDLSSEELWNN
jgi:hypothetical protein